MLNVLIAHEDHLVPTLAGLLAFGSYPQQFEPQLNITVVVYPANHAGEPGPRGERFIENRSVDGSIPAMVAETIRILKRNMRRRSVISGLFRTDEWEYPEKELKELADRGLVDQFGNGGSTYYELAAGISAEDEHLVSTPATVGQKLTELQHQVYSALTNEPAPRREIVKRTGLESDQVAQVLQALRSKGLVTMTGEPRSRDALWRSVR